MKNVIKKIRKQSNMTQEKLSKLCGVARQTINSVENDKYDPTLELAFKISRALDKNVEEVFIYDEIS
ncbi:helix-turn-helix transcriptional regulator [Oceanobacillus jeddahense]|uniref:helix-turn-helix transcriptional regulator n=1 Tax=Oceanobacillus jeddahense TaxID=1462527 RepID=UPI000595E833|nr:helix-turn-helix transcriptional regulator [Oceanobacillus jeddahense]